MKIYLVGKITGDPDYRKKFEAAADYVKSQRPDAVVLNPAVLPAGLTEQDYMTITGQMLAAADEVMCLADWEDSEGAKIEYALAKKTGKEISCLPALSVAAMTPAEFEAEMRKLFDYEKAGHTEEAHACADDLMELVLEQLGYSKGVKIFENMGKWYA